MLTRIGFENFTAFKKLDIKFSPGINVFIGENATGKTHILKAAYAACSFDPQNGGLASKINNVFLPSNRNINRLVHRRKGTQSGSITLHRQLEEKEIGIKLSLTSRTTNTKLGLARAKWSSNLPVTAYIPVKDMLAHSPGFLSLYLEKNIYFEEIYRDIIAKALVPLSRGPVTGDRKAILDIVSKELGGKVFTNNEEFFLKNNQGHLEFTLLAEGLRKLGLIWVLIQNNTLMNGSILFWDEPETNLNPKLMKSVAKILVKLERAGTQIFLATHNYVFMKYLSLELQRESQIKWHSLYRETDTKEIKHNSFTDYLKLEPNAIDETYGDLLDRDIEKQMAKLKW